MNASILRRLLRMLPAALFLVAGTAQAAYSCNVSATSVGVIYARGGANRVDVVGAVTLNCTRDLSDANVLSYQIGANNGNHYAGGSRRVRRGTSGDYLDYSLTRGAAVGGAATCADSSNWDQGFSNSMVGTVNFGAGSAASATWGFCVRIRGNQGNPTAGQYVDIVGLGAQYPMLTGATTTGTFTYTVGARNQCVMNSFPTEMNFNYNSFQPAPQVTTQTFRIACSNNLPWSVALAPANGTLLGLNYTLSRAPASGTGNGAAQDIVITGTMPANQQGTCATATCSATQPHTLTVTY